MLHVLLLILKIIGWILLGIIGLLLLLVMLILFCPIRYQADISYQGGKTLQAKAKVRYLILSVRVLYDQSREKDKLKQEIRRLYRRLPSSLFFPRMRLWNSTSSGGYSHGYFHHREI